MATIANENYMKFPQILKEKLLTKEIEFSDSVLFIYDEIRAYRAIDRTEDNFSPVTKTDFKSYFELGKTPKGSRYRGQKVSLEKRCDYYGVSLFTDKKIVENKLKLPNPNQKICVGIVYCEGGPQETTQKGTHVCWWLYENIDLDGFIIEKE